MTVGQTCWYVACDCKSTDFEVDTGDEVLSCHVSTDSSRHWVITSRLIGNIDAIYCADCNRQITETNNVDLSKIGIAT